MSELINKGLLNMETLKQLIKRKTIMLGGHSGVGKTSIVNILVSLNLKVSGISQHSPRNIPPMLSYLN